MDWPVFVYRCPGSAWGPPNTTFQALSVADQKAYEAALNDGWFATLPEAAEDFLRPKAEPVRVMAVAEEGQTFDDEAPPTRDEMLAKASEIGLAVDKRWSDRTLAAKILEALK